MLVTFWSSGYASIVFAFAARQAPVRQLLHRDGDEPSAQLPRTLGIAEAKGRAAAPCGHGPDRCDDGRRRTVRGLRLAWLDRLGSALRHYLSGPVLSSPLLEGDRFLYEA